MFGRSKLQLGSRGISKTEESHLSRRPPCPGSSFSSASPPVNTSKFENAFFWMVAAVSGWPVDLLLVFPLSSPSPPSIKSRYPFRDSTTSPFRVPGFPPRKNHRRIFDLAQHLAVVSPAFRSKDTRCHKRDGETEASNCCCHKFSLLRNGFPR